MANLSVAGCTAAAAADFANACILLYNVSKIGCMCGRSTEFCRFTLKRRFSKSLHANAAYLLSHQGIHHGAESDGKSGSRYDVFCAINKHGMTACARVC